MHVSATSQLVYDTTAKHISNIQWLPIVKVGFNLTTFGCLYVALSAHLLFRHCAPAILDLAVENLSDTYAILKCLYHLVCYCLTPKETPSSSAAVAVNLLPKLTFRLLFNMVAFNVYATAFLALAYNVLLLASFTVTRFIPTLFRLSLQTVQLVSLCISVPFHMAQSGFRALRRSFKSLVRLPSAIGQRSFDLIWNFQTLCILYVAAMTWWIINYWVPLAVAIVVTMWPITIDTLAASVHVKLFWSSYQLAEVAPVYVASGIASAQVLAIFLLDYSQKVLKRTERNIVKTWTVVSDNCRTRKSQVRTATKALIHRFFTLAAASKRWRSSVIDRPRDTRPRSGSQATELDEGTFSSGSSSGPPSPLAFVSRRLWVDESEEKQQHAVTMPQG